MRDEATARLQRYLRVAYGGAEGAPDEAGGADGRTVRRWAVGPVAAVRVAALLLVLGVAAATVVLMARPTEAPAAPIETPMAVSPGADTGTTPATTEPEATGGAAAPDVVVHVAGAVLEPGVVELPPGTRVDEAIEAAGGAAEDADLDALNLAAPVADGQQVYVPREGEALAGGASQQPGAVGPTASGSTDSGGLVDINAADAAALESLPGIGPALAARIIAWRDEHGPFASVESLTDVSGIGPATMADLRDLVTV